MRASGEAGAFSSGLHRYRAAEHLYRPVDDDMAGASFGDRAARRHHRAQQAAGAESAAAVGRLDPQFGVDVLCRRVTEGRDPVDVGGRQAGILDGGAHRLHGQLQARDARATADSRDADAGQDRVFFEVGHMHRPSNQPATRT